MCIWFNKILIATICRPLRHMIPYMAYMTKCICKQKLTILIRPCPE